MNPEEQALLEQLKDVAQPADPGWWPPAIGWWLVLLVVMLLCVMVCWLIIKLRRKRQQDSWRSTALVEHRRIHDDFQNGESQSKTLAELSVLMRRVSLAVQPRRSVASLTDDQWLQSLDGIDGTRNYSSGAGRLLYRHQYQRELIPDDDAMSALFELTKNTIKKAGHQSGHQQGEASVAAL